ncbi:MAG: oxidoreductase [Candidatus Aminicenantes bacterium]|nr:MAG: oxidoreductase [Candidatus Aminicenantes bacterium]
MPLYSSNTILVKNIASLVSMGTERSIIELGKKSLLGKAKARPDLVKRFMDKAKKEGFVKTFQEALGRLDSPTPLGYSSAGVAIEVGENIHKFSPGDAVACIGAGYASHADYITVPENLCCRIPDRVTFEEASSGMLGIVALHGVRCARLTFGATVAVVGLGLLGLLTVQILKAYGCSVIGTDIDLAKLELATKLGVDIAIESSQLTAQSTLFTNGLGVDAVILTVATKSDEPVNAAVDIAKYGGRIVVVGVADIHPQRNEMWHKEVEIIVSKAGGPGIFDPFYEYKGIDYPIGYVRWTENRNLEEFLRLLSERRVDVRSLISHRFKIEQAETVYKDMLDNKGGPYVGVVLQYPEGSSGANNYKSLERTISLNANRRRTSNIQQAAPTVGVIGAGLFGKALLLPALKKIPSITLHTIATSSSTNTYHTAKKYGFEECTTDYKEILGNGDINSVVILTPHSLHAKMVCEALEAGKHVFVEKPLCIGVEELDQIMEAYSEVRNSTSSIPLLMVGYNRRFSPHAAKMAEYLSSRRDPLVLNYRVNPGFVPKDHWVHSKEEGGSRVIGEICHFVDTMQFLTQAYPVRVYAERASGNDRTIINSDNLAITLKFSDGSVGNIIYAASGDKAFSRERIEVFFDGNTIVCDDFRRTHFYLGGKISKFKTSSQEQGYEQELRHFFDAVSGRSTAVVNNRDVFTSTLTTFKINESLDKGEAVSVSL